ncbi:MAG: DUF4783 domain-containing protein [Bacteroidota bacterium]|nr:DUF4783 domain-containing protein [Bacteroidota bacterium]
MSISRLILLGIPIAVLALSPGRTMAKSDLFRAVHPAGRIEDQERATDSSAVRKVFSAAEAAIAGGELQGITGFLHAKVFLTLATGENGYYSAEQTLFILRNFFRQHAPLGFSFGNTKIGAESAYGVGFLRYVKRGQQGTAQVFLSLTRTEQGWRIDQITIARR